MIRLVTMRWNQLKLMRGIAALLGLCALLMLGREVSAVEVSIPHVRCDVTLSKDTIISGEPVNLCFSFTNTSDGPLCVDVDDRGGMGPETLLISLRAADGREVPRRELPCRPASQHVVLRSPGLQFKPGEHLLGEYPLHLRFSTRLEPGRYTVTVSRFDVAYGIYPLDGAESRVKIVKTESASFSTPPLSLEVLPYDVEGLQRAYDALMEEARYARAHPPGSWCGYDFLDIPAPIRTILWAEGPEAIPGQLELLYDAKTGFTYWPPAAVHAWANIAHYATAEQVATLVSMVKETGLRRWPNEEYSRTYSPGLIWALRQLHQNGSEAIKGIIGEVIDLLPEVDICPGRMEMGVMPYGKSG